MSFFPFQTIARKWRSYLSELTYDFYRQISELLEHDMVMQLDEYSQHYGYTRLRHCLDVAYYSYLIARILRWDAPSVARAGLLHDLFFYDWRDEDYVCEGRNHAWEHPKIALRNARSICQLNPVEENIIRRHMWLATFVPPRYKEGYIVTFVDKYCAMREMLIGLLNSSHKPRAVYANNM